MLERLADMQKREMNPCDGKSWAECRPIIVRHVAREIGEFHKF